MKLIFLKWNKLILKQKEYEKYNWKLSKKACNQWNWVSKILINGIFKKIVNLLQWINQQTIF